VGGSSRAKRRPWYADGLRFECSRCGDCCRGEPGFVWVTRTERQAVAAYLNMEQKEFDGAYVRTVAFGKSLKELPDGDCIFWDSEQGCRIYPVRPRQCRTFPFWQTYLASPRDWARAAERCTGVNKGRLYTFEEIEAQRKDAGGL